MKHLIMSLLLLTGVAAKAQNFKEHKRGDTTFYLIPDYFDQFELMAGKHSMDIGYVGDQVYRFSVHRETKTVFAVPVSKQWPNVGMSYPDSHHTHKHEDWKTTQDYKEMQEWVRQNKGKQNVVW